MSPKQIIIASVTSKTLICIIIKINTRGKTKINIKDKHVEFGFNWPPRQYENILRVLIPSLLHC